jgi:hypothetical protein
MALYFMLHDAERFETMIRPALAESRRQRSLAPCIALRTALATDIEAFISQNSIPRENLMLYQVRPEMQFEPNIWRMLVGELLLAAAGEVPEVPDVEASLVGRLGEVQSIRQAYHGSQDLCFGGGWYRPDHAAFNDLADVRRLAGFLESMDPDSWTGEDSAPLDERLDDLTYARQGLTCLTAIYARARSANRLIVCEEIV